MKAVKKLKEEQGIALVTSLMLTFLALVVILCALYLMTVATKQSGMVKSYKSALQASYGGSDMIMKDLIPQMLMSGDVINQAIASGSTATIAQTFQTIASNFSGLNDLAFGPNYGSATVAAQCLSAKLTSSPSGQLVTGGMGSGYGPAWSTVCPSPGGAVTATSLKPKDLPDFKFTVPGASGAPAFTVFSKIVDTVPGNSDMSGTSLMGSGVAETQSNIAPQHIPYVFRIEVQAERSNNPSETADLSFLYAY
ncbi:hypothetical protein L4X63_19070 [Geomonas sp. Red32]|uniref:hypothetical protein n=1 Tax=Geomonas sp. Red32 TaxID=2912856 RepID=UPI00202CE950|nr:hypothetical protein [Geomonas sp. Red32]MCM0083693.1 hypothetical protein [Geomonas sp. Red32]